MTEPAVQRSLKFEIQTKNKVFAIKNTGPADPKLLPRKFASTSKGYTEEVDSQERGDLPAYLSVGHAGGPARKAGDVSFVEAEGPLVTEEAKSASKTGKPAQVLRDYQFKTKAKAKDLIGKPVADGQLKLVKEVDHGTDPHMTAMFDYEANTFEFRYLNPNGSRVDVHLDENHRFQAGHLSHIKVGRGDLGIDKSKTAQFIEVLRVRLDPKGSVDFLGKPANIERVSLVDNAKDKALKGTYNPGTWQKRYFAAADFTGTKLKSGAKPLDAHMDKDGRFVAGKVKFMRKEILKRGHEQTAIEVQSEHGGVIEFETPKWFRDWSELKERLEEAVAFTKTVNDHRKDPAKVIKDKKTIDEIKKQSGKPGPVVEWPELSTAHLTKLRTDNRRLVIQIVDDKWRARIQASEAIALSQYGSLLQQHEETDVAGIAFGAGFDLFEAGVKAAKAKNPAIDESRLANLKGFLQLISTYIARGQVHPNAGKPAKFTFWLMARTGFGSMFQSLLSAEERAIFAALVSDKGNPILKTLQPLINAERAKQSLPPITLTRTTKFFAKKVGTDPVTATLGPSIHGWLEGMTKGKDLLTGKDSGEELSGAMGARKVSNTPGDKDYKRAQFEVRGTTMFGGNDKFADNWIDFARTIFNSAMERATDTPDDPTTPTVDESSKTGLKE